MIILQLLSLPVIKVVVVQNIHVVQNIYLTLPEWPSQIQSDSKAKFTTHVNFLLKFNLYFKERFGLRI